MEIITNASVCILAILVVFAWIAYFQCRGIQDDMNKFMDIDRRRVEFLVEQRFEQMMRECDFDVMVDGVPHKGEFKLIGHKVKT